jgi:hypothetical protein
MPEKDEQNGLSILPLFSQRDGFAIHILKGKFRCQITCLELS